MFRAALIALFVAASASVAVAQPPGKTPMRPAYPMPPEPARMGQPIYLYPVYPAPYGFGPVRYGYGYGAMPKSGDAAKKIPAPYPGSAMVYPYPRTVSSYSFGPSAYPIGWGYGWGR